VNCKAIIIPLVVAVSLGFAACGGDDDDETLSKADLAKKANAICKEANEDSGPITAPPDVYENPVAAEAYFGKLAPIYQKQVDGLAKLQPNDDTKAAWTQFLDREKQSNETLKTALAKAKAKDPSGVRHIAKQQRVLTKLTSEATAIGASECASV